ncbi:MAG: repeat-like domain [Thermoplasmata archaeon]|nr:repeat-like domain [Thermoplasmata archaeon]
MRSLAVLWLAVLLAGCAASPTPAPIPAQPAVAAGAPAFDAPVVAAECTSACIEPTIAVGLDGTVYVAGFRQPGLLVSHDAGQTYEVVASPPFPSPSPLAGSGSDDLVQVAPWGELFFTRLMTESFYNTPGVQVAGSLDGGATWATNVFVHPRTVPGDLDAVSDRQWLAFDGTDTVYLSFNSGASVTQTVVVSQDRGATFGGPVIAATSADHTFPSPAGAPVVGPGHEIVIPYFVGIRTDGQVGSHGVGAAVSKDGGRTFSNIDVFVHESLGTQAGFPQAAALPNGTYVVGWSTTDGSIWLSFSGDGGTTWSLQALQFGPEVAHADSYPWLEARPGGGFDALYFGENAGAHEARLLRFAADGAVTFGELHGKMGGDTDFSTLAHLPDGRAISAFVTGEGQVTTIVETRG